MRAARGALRAYGYGGRAGARQSRRSSFVVGLGWLCGNYQGVAAGVAQRGARAGAGMGGWRDASGVAGGCESAGAGRASTGIGREPEQARGMGAGRDASDVAGGREGAGQIARASEQASRREGWGGGRDASGGAGGRKGRPLGRECVSGKH